MSNKIQIIVHTPFNLTLSEGKSFTFTAGKHVVSEEVAKHWFTQAHADVGGLVSKTDKDSAKLIAQLEGLKAEIAQKDQTIGELTKKINHLIAAQDAESNPTPPVIDEGNKDGKKPKPTDSK